MKKQAFALAVSFLFSGHVAATDSVFSDPKTLLPNENIQHFEMADINGDGVEELVFVTVNGELKFSQQTGSGDGLLNYDDLSEAKKIKYSYSLNVDLEGTSHSALSLNYGRVSVFRNGDSRVRCTASMALKDGNIEAKSANGKITFTYFSEKKIAGTIRCTEGDFKQSEAIKFVATR